MKTGAGGLVSTLLPLMEQVHGTWIASAMTEMDSDVAKRYNGNRVPIPEDNPKFWSPLIITDPQIYKEYYGVINNLLLWFIHHYMWNLAYTPDIDDKIHKAWESYEYVNHQFADKIIEEVNSNKKKPLIMLQDIHLFLCPIYIKEELDDVFLSHFIHIPWPHPDYFSILPDYMAKSIVEGLLSNDLIGFHIKKYVKNFLTTCEKYADEVDFKNNKVIHNGREIFVKDYPISVDDKKLKMLAKSENVLKKEDVIKRIKNDRFLIYRTERTDPSKNIIRGFKAYNLFLEKYPEFQGKVVFLKTGMSSRESVKEYRDYGEDVNKIIEEVNDKYSQDDWKPIETIFNAEYTLVTAALKNYDCLLVNSIYDGMNIVPKEGAVVNEKGGVLILSETTGAYGELKNYSLNINAFDISQTADAIYKAVTMDPDERNQRLEGLKNIISEKNVYVWMMEQFNDIGKLF
jgi:trehalose 6-phosphate synthase